MSDFTETIFIKASKYWDQGCDLKAFECFLEGAEAGNPGCMLNVGVMYGDGVVPDIENRHELFWYKKAWGEGETSSATNIAIVYKNQKQFKQAETWFQLAIDSGDGDANLELAKMYLSRNLNHDNVKKYLKIPFQVNLSQSQVSKKLRNYYMQKILNKLPKHILPTSWLLGTRIKRAALVRYYVHKLI